MMQTYKQNQKAFHSFMDAILGVGFQSSPYNNTYMYPLQTIFGLEGLTFTFILVSIKSGHRSTHKENTYRTASYLYLTWSSNM